MRFTELTSSAVFAARFFDIAPQVVGPSVVPIQTTQAASIEKPPVRTSTWDDRCVRISIWSICFVFNVMLALNVYPIADQFAEYFGLTPLDAIQVGMLSVLLSLPLLAAANVLLYRAIWKKL